MAVPKLPYQYHIVLDTTVFYGDFDIKSPAFKGLFHFLSVSNSTLYIPEVVLEEVKKGYKAQLTKHHSQIQKAINQYDGIAELKKSPTEIFEDFVKRWDTRIRINPNVKLAKTPTIKIDDLLARSLAERAPFGSHSRGFRDAVIWETVLSLIKENDAAFVFISNNSDDFGKDNLIPSLVEELKGKAKNFHYFHDISSFLSEKGETLELLNDELVQKWLGECDELFATTAHDLFSFEYKEVFDLSKLDHYHDLEDYSFGEVEYEDFELDNYYVYKEDDKYFYIEVELWILMLVGVTYTYNAGYRTFEDSTYYGYGSSEDQQVISGSKPYSVQFRVDKKTMKHEFWAE